MSGEPEPFKPLICQLVGYRQIYENGWSLCYYYCEWRDDEIQEIFEGYCQDVIEDGID
jgi:hypothetical protein